MQRKISAFSECAIWARFISVMSALISATPPSGRGWLVEQLPVAIDGLRFGRQHVALPPACGDALRELDRCLHRRAVEALEVRENSGNEGGDGYACKLVADWCMSAENLGIGVHEHAVCVEQRIACATDGCRTLCLH